MGEKQILLGLLPRPRVVPPLDQDFRPAILAVRAFEQEVGPEGQRIVIALERSDGTCSRFEWSIFPPDHRLAKANLFFLERLLKFLLWSRGGYRIILGGVPEPMVQDLARHYRESPTGRFDAWIMGQKIYEKSFEVVGSALEAVPPDKESSKPLGGNWDGSRIGFDLGASDIKVAAVQDGQVVYTNEFPWDPRSFNDPQLHFDYIMAALRRAAEHLPRVDAIGGSAAGVYVNNEVKIASLFRGVPEELFQRRVKRLFFEIQDAWGGVPFEIANDGDVAALAGSQVTGSSPLLGIAMGSSEAGGYINSQGFITGWLNELAFAPIDYSPTAPIDEWSGDRGCGAQYFSQQAVGRLIPRSGLTISTSLPLPEQLVLVQEAMARGDERARLIYETIGVWFGYAVAYYRRFYEFRHILVLGRVVTGEGGTVILQRARRVLEEEFPELSNEVHIYVPDERMKRHGQAVAAASLPRLRH